MRGMTHGVKEENLPRANFNRKFTIDYKLSSRDYSLDSSIPTAEVDFRIIAEKLGTTVDMVQFVLKLLIQEIGRMIRDEIASQRISSLRLRFGKVGTLTGSRRTIQFSMHPSIREGTSRQYIEIDRNGPQLYGGQREYLLYNQDKTRRVAQDPHRINPVRSDSQALSQSQRLTKEGSSPTSFKVKGLYASLNMKTAPHLNRSARIMSKTQGASNSRPSTAHSAIQRSSRKQSARAASRPSSGSSRSRLSDLPPVDSELKDFFQKGWNGANATM